MDQATHNRMVSFLWGIADDVLRDLFRRGKYPDVILPMAVLRRLDAALEPTKTKVLEAKTRLDAAEIKEQEAALRAAAGQALAARHKSKKRCVRTSLRSLGGRGAMRRWGCQTKPTPCGFPRPASF
ncbi:type I restriction-modification system subunit M N-terminal domain-containing protein [Synechococcus sp. EJ6-Ellesmere]|nr:type I restriction-modification system subunit M N-terminal domain-containing protein [Synechococcus sp. EJ6-Ellesmere]